MTRTSAQTVSAEPQEVGNARLRQVRNFIEQVEPAQADIMQLLLGALRGRLVLGAMLGGALGMIGAIAIFLSVTPVFQSQGLMRIVARESKILYTDSDDSRLRLFDSFVAAEVTYLGSRPVLERTLKKLETSDIAKLPRDVGELANTIQVTGLKGLVTIAAKSSDGKTAAAIVNGLLDAFAELRLEQTEGQHEFRTRELSTREANLLTQLQAIDKSILDVGEEYGQDAIAKAHVSKISQIDEISGRIDELTSTINQLETVGYAMDADTGDIEIKRSMLLDNSMASMTYDRAKKAAEASSLAKRYRADHPKVVAAIAEIAVLDKAIDERRAQIATLGRTGALTQRDQKKEQSIDELRALLGKLQERKNGLETDAMDLIARIVRLGYLKEERAQTRGRLDETRRVLEEVRVESRNASPGITEVVARGSVPDRPFEDKRKAMAIVGLMGGFVFGFAIIALWGLLRPSIRNESDIKALGKSVVAAGTFESPEASVHRLRNTLHVALSRQGSEQGRVLAIVGAARHQGATTLARALAQSFHQAGSATAIIDGHLDQRTMSRHFAASGHDGLTEWLMGPKSAPLPLESISGITLLPAGHNQDIHDHSLSPRDLRQVMTSLAAEHDIVLADCGAVNHALSATLFAAQSDAVLLVLRRGVSLSEARSAVAVTLAASRKQVLVVLTGQPGNAVPDWIWNAVAPACQKLINAWTLRRKST